MPDRRRQVDDAFDFCDLLKHRGAELVLQGSPLGNQNRLLGHPLQPKYRSTNQEYTWRERY